MSAADSITPTLRICSCAGAVISETQLDKGVQAPGTASDRGRLVSMGWTDGEMLVMVREGGGVEVRDIMVRGLSVPRFLYRLEAPDHACYCDPCNSRRLLGGPT